MFEKERKVAEQAVLAAMGMTKLIQQELSVGDAITKADRSPVTIADFASQAIICRILHREFPHLPIVAEEDSAALKRSENREILDKIVAYIDRDAGIRNFLNRDNLFESIDLGCQSPNQPFWTLDPIDGTKGFLRGEQFALALALIVEGSVKLGILGCPNLTSAETREKSGCLVSAVRGEGAVVRDIHSGQSRPARVSGITDPRRMRFVESYVSAHSNQEMQGRIAEILNIAAQPVQMDSQVKYGLVATGRAEIYLRIPHPKTPDYKEKIWDHAAGSLVVEEAGGLVTDILGQKLDFNAGEKLQHNTGILAAIPAIHPRVIDTIRQLRNS
jgi:HAL2 family 3'(2'),5'-bisphosphate nucleotidase